MGNTDGIGIGPTSGHLPHFVTWNWSLIRKFLFWGVLSGLLACVAAVVAMVAALPRTCNPDLPWYQGKLFYEIFPASYQDSNGDGIGDLRGLASRVNYIKNLGVKAVRLNSILSSRNYPDQYYDVDSLTEIDKTMGSFRDFTELVEALHERNISLILDLQIHPFVTELGPTMSSEQNENKNNSDAKLTGNWKISNEKSVTEALKHWMYYEVDGFYLKGLENLVNDPNFPNSVREWKKTIGPDRILIVNFETAQSAVSLGFNNIMDSIDLVDVLLDIGNGSAYIKNQVDTILNGILMSKPGYPWIHWTVGNVDSKRLSVKLQQNNTLSAILLNMMLPGTPSIFYGDEISLQEVSESEEDFHESEHVHNLIPMVWPETERQFTGGDVLPWVTSRETMSTPFWHISAISLLATIRPQAAPIYVNSIWRDGNILPNTQIRYTGNIIVIERWYPRKNSYVFVSNLGNSSVVTDLSMWFYGGTVVVGSDVSLLGKGVVFKAITLAPAEVIIIKLEK